MKLTFSARAQRIVLGILWAASLSWPSSQAYSENFRWQAGVARVNISPELPIWLSGYASRNKPAPDKLDDLWAKALVIEDANGRRAVLVTMDLVGIDRDLSREVCRRIEERFHLPRSAIVLAVSHTHSGPVVGTNLAPMYSLDERQIERIKNYTTRLMDNLVDVVGSAVASLKPAQLSWSTGTATFAVNRRNNPEAAVPERRQQNTLVGPVDHDVPVLAVYDDGSQLRAVVCGYACHATVLNGDAVSADWPGAAQRELEQRHRNTMVLYWAGCGGDQNPLPRRSVAAMNEHGRAYADAVDATLRSQLKPIPATLETEYNEIPLPFGELLSREKLEALAAAGALPKAPWARYLLDIWQRDGSLPANYPYPVQAWRMGGDLNWLFLGGEVVVDYSLRLKSELGPKTTWVASYSNDVMGYIPSERVLIEGGYEGGESRFYYGLPAVWASGVEQTIIDAAQKLVRKP